GSAALKKVATLYGKFKFFELDQAQNMSIGRLCIATKCKKFIDEDVIVEINGESFDVHVRELSNWSVKFEEDNESEDGLSDNYQVDPMSHSYDLNGQEEEHKHEQEGVKDQVSVNEPVNEHEDVAVNKDPIALF
ncbi:hypothetical protein Tco_0530020, partial [Tanacetum coccineum]